MKGLDKDDGHPKEKSKGLTMLTFTCSSLHRSTDSELQRSTDLLVQTDALNLMKQEEMNDTKIERHENYENY